MAIKIFQILSWQHQGLLAETQIPALQFDHCLCQTIVSSTVVHHLKKQHDVWILEVNIQWVVSC